MPRTTNGPRYLEITERVLEQMRRGNAPWERPWRSGRPENAVSGRRYRGINRLMLELTAAECGFTSNRWLTFAAAKRAGGGVRKGEPGTMVVCYERRPRRAPTEPAWDREVDTEWVYLCQHFWLWNLEQTRGDGQLWEATSAPPATEPLAMAQSIVVRSGASVRTGGEVASYSPALDEIAMPSRNRFISEEAYYATLYHEIGHWTGHASRLARELSGRFGEPQYAAEELVAELCAAFLSAEAGLEVRTEQHAAYLSSWMRLLEGDCRAIVLAAREAQRAADYVMGDMDPGVHPAVEIGVDEGVSGRELVAID